MWLLIEPGIYLPVSMLVILIWISAGRPDRQSRR